MKYINLSLLVCLSVAAFAQDVQFDYDPRGTPENRPMRDTSKPANEREAGQVMLYLASGAAGNSFFRN